MKHTEQFKLTVVEKYLEGIKGYRRVGEEYRIAPAMVRRWVAWYRAHGAEGLIRKTGGHRYSVDFKLSVLEHMWENALSYTQAAALFNVRNVRSIAVWASRYRDRGPAALARSQNAMKAPTSQPDSPPGNDKRTHEDLLKEIEYLRMENAYLKKVEALVQAKKNSTAPKKRK